MLSSVSASFVRRLSLWKDANPARTWFFTKKARSALMKIKSVRPDIVVLDLEDSIKAAEKQSVVKEYVTTLKEDVLGGIPVYIRTGELDRMEGGVEEDVYTFIGLHHVKGFILPKVEKAEDVRKFEDIIARAESQKHLKPLTAIVPLVESSKAYFNLHNIAASSNRNVAIIVGGADFTTSAMCEEHSHTYRAFYSKTVLAARAANIEPIWSVHDKIDSHAEFERICADMKRSGFSGAAVVTPKQVQLANVAFSYCPKQLKWIKDVLCLQEDEKGNAINLIHPSVQESRQMIGPPHIKKATTMRERHAAIETSTAEAGTRNGDYISPTTTKKGLSKDTKVGEFVVVPYQVTVTNGWKVAWESAFLPSQGFNTSLVRAKKLGLNDLPIPFSLAVSLTAALAVSSLSYHARAHLAFTSIFQNRTLVAGDTVRALFRVEKVEHKLGANKEYSIAHSTHWLINQNNEVVIQLHKKTMFDARQLELKSSCEKKETLLHSEESHLRRWLVQKPSTMLYPLVSQCSLVPGQLIAHDLVKVAGHSEARMLCALLYIVNPHHHNIVRYQPTDILVPGPIVMSGGMSNSALDIGEVIYEEMPLCIHPNKTNFGDQIGTLTYVQSCHPLAEGNEMEEVTMKQLLIKNTDPELLLSTEIPKRLLEDDLKLPSDYEIICANECPFLLHKIVCILCMLDLFSAL
ncbi:hypothetical protein EMCRGX_G010238 [Ephydatia muelleri]